MVIVCPVMIDQVYTDPYFIVPVKENNEFVGRIAFFKRFGIFASFY